MTGLAADIATQGLLMRCPLPDDELAEGRRALASSRVVRFAGIGSSRHVAAYGATCLEVLAQRPATVLASPGAGVPQPRFSPDELLVVVSQSGATPALLALGTAARSAGATVLAVINADASPLEELASLTLHAGAGTESIVPATKSVTMTMLLLRALAGPINPAQLTVLADVVEGLPHDQELRAMTCHPLPASVVCGGFAGQAVADEVALKLAEVVAHLAVPESIVDFLHGPAAVPGAALAFLDPHDPNAASIALRPGTLSVGPSAAYNLQLRTCGDSALDAIAQVVAGQCLALHWALATGIDPDDPRGLQKVTLTA